MQSPVLPDVEVPKHALESYHMLIARVLIIPAEISDGICDIGPSGSHHIHEASNHRFVYGWITGFFFSVSLVKHYGHWRGNWSGRGHPQLGQEHPNVAVLMDVDQVMLLIAFDIDAEIEGNTREIMHLEPHLRLVHDLPNQAVISNNEKSIDLQNDCGNDFVLIVIMEHQQSYVDTRYHEPNRDHEFLQSAVQNVRRLFQAIKRLSLVENQLARCD
jgi:hypothetical protein